MRRLRFLAFAFVVSSLASIGPWVETARAAQPGGPVELTSELLDHWLAAMRRIGSDNLNAARPDDPLTQSSPAALDKICSDAGFASPGECGCTVLYVAVLMNGFDKDAHGFLDPALALQRRISAKLKRTDLSEADIRALGSDRRMLFALRKALPSGVPPAHLSLMDSFVHEHLASDVNLWRQLAVGMKAQDTSAIGNRCTRLPALTNPTH